MRYYILHEDWGGGKILAFSRVMKQMLAEVFKRELVLARASRDCVFIRDFSV